MSGGINGLRAGGFAAGPYQVVARHTGTTMGHYQTLRAAHLRADKLDADYGAVRYTVRKVQS
jgi:hypothetical protein